MDLGTLADLGEFVSGVVVVVSLVYLAVQVKQNTRSLRTENYARALDRISAIQSQLSRDAVLTALFSRALLGSAALSPRERLQFTWCAYEFFGAFEFIFHQARAGALPDEVWERWAATTAWWLSFPGIREWWAARPTPFSASFSGFVDGCIRESRVDPSAAARWQTYVEGGGAAEAAP